MKIYKNQIINWVALQYTRTLGATEYVRIGYTNKCSMYVDISDHIFSIFGSAGRVITYKYCIKIHSYKPITVYNKNVG